MSAQPAVTREYVFPFNDELYNYVFSAKTQNIGYLLKQLSEVPSGQKHCPYTAVSYVMLEARQLIESLTDSEKNNFRLLRIYGHLVAHLKVEADVVLYDQLDEIAEAARQAMGSGGQHVTRLFYEVIANALSPSILRSQIKSLFASKGIESPFWDDDESWGKFVEGLSFVIAWKRIGIPEQVVIDEITAMGGLVDQTPPCSPPTKADEPKEHIRRAKKYFRKMATTVGFPNGVPISLHLVPRQYILQQLQAETVPALKDQLLASLPEDVCWAVATPGGLTYAPFAKMGVPPASGP